MTDLRVDLLSLFHSMQEVVGGAGRGPSLTNMQNVVLFPGEGPPGEKPIGITQRDNHGNVLRSGLAGRPPPLDLGLVLGCSQAGSAVACGTGGVHITDTPFISLHIG